MERNYFIIMLIAGLALVDLAGAAYLWSLWPSRPGVAVRAEQRSNALPTASVLLGKSTVATVKSSN